MDVSIKFEITSQFLTGDIITHSFIGVRRVIQKEDLPKTLCSTFLSASMDSESFAVADKDITPAKMENELKDVELTDEYQLIDSFNPTDDPFSVMNIYLKNN